MKTPIIDIGAPDAFVDIPTVRKLIYLVFLIAIRDQSDEIRFEPQEHGYKLSYSYKGTFYEMVPPPAHLAARISNIFKIMANLRFGTSAPSRLEIGVADMVASWEVSDNKEVSYEQEVHCSSLG